jgi:thiamine pyrophosphokinase
VKTLIITGGKVSNEVLVRVYNNTFEYVMAVDGGLTVIDEYNKDISENKNINDCNRMNITPDLSIIDGNRMNILVDCIIGDFDTVKKDVLQAYQNIGIKVVQFPPEKNYTDTHLALLKAIEFGASDITIVGAIGSRMDHTMANIGLLNITLKHKIPCKIIDDKNIIQMIDDKVEINAKDGKYISLLPTTECVTGIYLGGFKYPLSDATISQGESIGISNELTNEIGQIRITSGKALVIQAND